ncbi:MAG: hypothetical protein ACREGA_02560 [Candidatus Saccharimonadales bacterium]
MSYKITAALTKASASETQEITINHALGMVLYYTKLHQEPQAFNVKLQAIVIYNCI